MDALLDRLPRSTDDLSPLTIAVTAILVPLASYIVYNLFLHPLADLPGPFLVRAGVWSFRTTRAFKRDAGWKYRELHEKYGTIVRVGKNEAMHCDPEAINEIFKHGSPLYKSRFYAYFRAPQQDGLMSTQGNHAHSLMRRAEAPAYTLNFLLAMEEYVDSCGRDLFEYFDKKIKAEGGKGTFEMADTLQFLALDVVGELAFGSSFGLAKAGKDVNEYLPMLVSFVDGCVIAGTQPSLGPLMMWIVSKINANVKGAQGLSDKAQECVIPRIARAREGKIKPEDDRSDILSKLIAAKHADGKPYSPTDILVASTSVLGAGSDTTAITMRAIIRNIVIDPRVYKKVLQEIDTAVEDGTISFPLSYAQSQKLTYFQACLKETLRYHPAVPWPLPRVIPAEGASILGRYYAPGVEVSMNPYCVHRRPEAYGKDADEFKPERWIDVSEDERKVLERNMIAFGSGSRICIGRNISLMEISKIIPALLYKYRIAFTPRSPTSPHKSKLGRTVNGELSEKEPWDLASAWFNVQTDFFCDLEIRHDVELA